MNDNKEINAGMFGLGQPNDTYAQFFIGQSYLNVLTTEGEVICNVTFEPGCRNNWHVHNAKKGGGQILMCTSGKGWYQEEGKAAVAMTPGSVVSIKTGVKHWHGAAKDSWFSHIAIEVPGENTSTQWLEPVTDEVYNAL